MFSLGKVFASNGLGAISHDKGLLVLITLEPFYFCLILIIFIYVRPFCGLPTSSNIVYFNCNCRKGQ